MSIIDTAYYILSNYVEKSKGGITHLKLQKLLYYLYVWGLVSKQKLFETKFKAWKFGPVNLEIYSEFKNQGSNPITFKNYSDKKFNENDSEFVDFVITNYIKFSALTLSAMTHKEKPWKITGINQTIPEDDIINYYKKQNFAKNFPLSANNKYYPIQTDIYFSFILDMDKKASSIEHSYDSYKLYLEKIQELKKEFEENFNTADNIL